MNNNNIFIPISISIGLILGIGLLSWYTKRSILFRKYKSKYKKNSLEGKCLVVWLKNHPYTEDYLKNKNCKYL